MEHKPGDTVQIVTDSEEIKGILMPSPDSGILVIKLDSGYNIGVAKSKVNKIHVVEKFVHQQSPAKTPELLQGNLPKISILHTGGTIASKVDYPTGGVSAKFSEQEILGLFPELKGIAHISSKLISNMFSEDMRFAHYNLIAKAVEEEVSNGAEGIIVTHGTDTLHYTAAALSFMLQGISIPVILVGAQRSSDRGSSDAARNLISAAYFIVHSDFAGVAICMHESMSDDDCVILPALKSRKMHTSRRDAFRPINASPIARVNYEDGKISLISKSYQKKGKNNLTVKLMNEKLRIGIIKAHPNMFAEEFSHYESFDGLIIEGTGLCNIPINVIDEHTKEHKRILDEVVRLTARMPVFMASQAINGRIHMDVYSTGRELQQAGVIGNMADMTSETAFIKLAFLLSNYPREQVRALMMENLLGEISERTESATFPE